MTFTIQEDRQWLVFILLQLGVDLGPVSLFSYEAEVQKQKWRELCVQDSTVDSTEEVWEKVCHMGAEGWGAGEAGGNVLNCDGALGPSGGQGREGAKGSSLYHSKCSTPPSPLHPPLFK